MSYPIRVLMINERRLFAEAIRTLLKNQERFEFLHSTETSNGHLPICSAKSPDVVLIEANVKGMLTTHLVERIKEETPHVKVIIFGLEEQQDEILNFIEAGAIGFISKEKSFADLLSLIEAVYHGRTLSSSRVIASAFDRMAEISREQSQGRDTQRVALTPREKEILHLVSNNLSNKEIAEHLDITLNTVKNHMHNILEKFDVRYRRELVRCASECGMLTQFK
jgi:two-component system, NarL family, nitrate/nitrite response regulator NarL